MVWSPVEGWRCALRESKQVEVVDFGLNRDFGKYGYGRAVAIPRNAKVTKNLLQQYAAAILSWELCSKAWSVQSKQMIDFSVHG